MRRADNKMVNFFPGAKYHRRLPKRSRGPTIVVGAKTLIMRISECNQPSATIVDCDLTIDRDNHNPS